MARRDDNLQARLERDLAELKLPEIARAYREVLDEAARKGSSMLEVLATLFGLEQAARQQRAAAAATPRGTAPQAEDPGRVRFQLPQADPQGGDPAALRLRLHRAARLRRADRTDRDGKVAFAHGVGLHGGRAWLSPFATRGWST